MRGKSLTEMQGAYVALTLCMACHKVRFQEPYGRWVDKNDLTNKQTGVCSRGCDEAMERKLTGCFTEEVETVVF